VVRLAGLLDALSVGVAARLFDALVDERAPRVMLDLAALRLVDGRGVGTIVRFVKRLRQLGGSVRIVGVREQPLMLFKLMRLDALLAPP
jgi:anti-sigma B factor antagonist